MSRPPGSKAPCGLRSQWGNPRAGPERTGRAWQRLRFAHCSECGALHVVDPKGPADESWSRCDTADGDRIVCTPQGCTVVRLGGHDPARLVEAAEAVLEAATGAIERYLEPDRPHGLNGV